MLEGWLPKGTVNITFASRVAGVGSLGRPRYVAVALAMADWSRARERHGCRPPGGGPMAARRTTPTRRGC